MSAGFDAPPNGTQGSRLDIGAYCFLSTIDLEQAGIPIFTFIEKTSQKMLN